MSPNVGALLCRYTHELHAQSISTLLISHYTSRLTLFRPHPVLRYCTRDPCLVVPRPFPTFATFSSMARSLFSIWNRSPRFNSRLPDRTKEKITKTVLQDYFGEQQPGSAFIVKNVGKGEKYKHIAFLSLVRTADAPHPVEFAYTAMRGLLLAILEFNQREENAIEVVAIPSFAISNTAEHKRYVATPSLSKYSGALS